MMLNWKNLDTLASYEELKKVELSMWQRQCPEKTAQNV